MGTKPERWKPVVGYEGHYEVSDLGNVRSKTRRISAPHDSRRTIRGRTITPFCDSHRGYWFVYLYGDRDYGERSRRKGSKYKGKMRKRRVGRHIGRLVLEAFVGPRPPHQEACHGPNHNVNDNRLTNLQWGSKKKNTDDREERAECGGVQSGEDGKFIVSEPDPYLTGETPF